MRPAFAKARGSIIRETADGRRDPDADEKDRAEVGWEQALLQFWGEQRRRIKERLERGIPQDRKADPDVGDWLDDAFWDEEYALMLAFALPLLKEAATQAAQTAAAYLEAEFGIAFDWTLASSAAVDWAAVHAGELITGINGTTQQAVARSVSSWLDTPGSTMGDLFSEIESLYAFGRSRAEMVAVTETTAAYGAGRQASYDQAGIPPQAYWEPAHPRCRCWTAANLLPSDEWVVVWQTNKDELVCKQPLDTPWGVAGGCQDLQSRVVSEGPYLGLKLSEARAEARG